MEVLQTGLGRLFLLKMAHGDDLLEEISHFAAAHQVRAAWLFFLGALKQGHLVCGPAAPTLPPRPVWQNFSQGWEILGLGNLFWEDDVPKLHLHGALGSFLKRFAPFAQAIILETPQQEPGDDSRNLAVARDLIAAAFRETAAGRPPARDPGAGRP